MRGPCRVLGIVLMSLILLGCRQAELYTDLSEQEANEMVALMQRAGLDATKVRGKESRFAVTTSKDRFATAIALLQANGLPRPRFDTLGDVFQEQGFVSSSTSQRARYIHALSQEISHTISSIDGVLLARVHLAVPERDPLDDAVAPSSASVFIKHRADVDLSGQVGQIKALVVNGLENLPYENVTVAMFEARERPVDAADALPLRPVRQATLDTAGIASPLALLPDSRQGRWVAAGGLLVSLIASLYMLLQWLRRQREPQVPPGQALAETRSADAASPGGTYRHADD